MKFSFLKSLKPYCGFGAVFSVSSLLFLSSLSVSGANITIDFRKLYTESDNQFLSSEEVLDFLDNQESTSGMISAITYCEGIYELNQLELNNLSSQLKGGLFIRSTDPVTKEDNGGISFSIAPRYRHRNTNINIRTYKDFDISTRKDIPFSIDIRVNDGDFQNVSVEKVSNTPDCNSNVNFKPNNEIIKELTIKVPNAAKAVFSAESKTVMDYYLILSYIDLYYNETNDNPQQVSKWEFSQGEYEAFLNSSDELELPVLLAEPAESAEMAEYTSSDPEVAEIKDGKIKINKVGTTTITASLPENPLFLESDSYAPASYLLSVKESQQTGIESLIKEESNGYTLFDLHGNIVKTNPLPGIYVRRSSVGAEKIVVR